MDPRSKPLRAALVLAIILASIGWVSVSFALTLQEAKSKGLLGEMPTGYLGVVNPPASPPVKALMNEINRKRKSKYEEIARRNATSLPSVEALAAQTAIKKTKPGQYIQLPSGEWRKK